MTTQRSSFEYLTCFALSKILFYLIFYHLYTPLALSFQRHYFISYLIIPIPPLFQDLTLNPNDTIIQLVMCQVYFHKGIILRWPQLSISVASWGKRGYSHRPQDQAVFHRSRRDSDKGSLQGSQMFGAGSSFVWKGGIYFYHLFPLT